jgi:hypothetical protein
MEAIKESELPLSEDLRERVEERRSRFFEHHGDSLGRRLWNDDFRDFAVVAADQVEADIAVWMCEVSEGESLLVPVYNGPRAESLVGRYRAPLQPKNGTPGFLARAFCLEQSGGGGVEGESERIFDPEVERLLGIRSTHFLAAPLYFGEKLRGVVSAVRFVDALDTAASAPPPFTPGDTLRFEKFVTWMGRLYDELIFTRTFEL